MRIPLLFLSCLSLLVGVFPSRAAEQLRRPNIVVILSDDMGFSDLGCYGGEIRTPNLDQLAENGLRFTQFYNTARCCPTRASLLTGLYPHQAGIGHMMEDKGKEGYRGDLNRRCVTLAEALRPAGYRNFAVGKWHVTRHAGPSAPQHNWPLQRGFDRCYCTITGAGSFFDPATLTRDNKAISPFADPEYQPKSYYYTDAISDQAVRYVAEHDRDHKDRPLFLYVAYTAAHWPMHALPEDMARYRGKYDSGYEAIRKARFEKSARLGLIDPKWGMTATVGEWSKVPDRTWEARCMEVYAAMIDRMDQGIGRLIAELKRIGQLENTLIFFMQDNGGCAEDMGRTGSKEHPNIARPEKPVLEPLRPEAILPVGVVPPQTRDGFPVRMGPKAFPGSGDTYVAYGRNWANVSNTPFREYKHWVHEGGISTPLIAHWPAGIKARGELRHQPGHLIDIAATCVAVAGAKYPQEHAGQQITPLEGQSLVAAFDNQAIKREAIYWEHEGNRAVRMGRWKLVSKHNQPWELYDLEADRIETKDLAASFPDRVKEVTMAYDRWAKRCGVETWPVEGKKKN